jgi:actin-related protein
MKLNNNKDIPVFIAEPPFTSKKQKRLLAELLFEKQDCTNLFFGTQGVLSVYAMGKM